MNAVQKKSKKSQRAHAQNMDYSILFLVLFLVGFGLVILYSTSSYKGSLYYNDTAYWVKKQGFFAVLGIIGMLIISKIDYHFWKKKPWFAWFYYGLTAVLLFITLILGAASHGAKRWIPLGPIKFQPSELAKITLILFLAAFISSKTKELRTVMGIFVPFVLSLPLIGMVGVENLSTCIIMLVICFVMIFVSTPLKKPFIAIIGIGLAGALILIATQGYRMTRIIVWRNPAAYEEGNQTMQGLYAIGSGGLFG